MYGDILSDLDLISIYSLRPNELTREQSDEVKGLPTLEKNRLTKEFLEKNQKEKNDKIYLLLLRIEQNMNIASMSPELSEKIASILKNIRTSNQTVINSLTDKLKTLETQVKNKAEEKTLPPSSLTPPSTSVVPKLAIGLVAADFIWNPKPTTPLEQKTISYYDDKLLDLFGSNESQPRSANNATQPGFVGDVIQKPKRGQSSQTDISTGLQTPKGSLYSNRHYTQQNQQADELNQILIADVQRKCEQQGKPIPSAESVLANVESALPVQRRLAKKAIYVAHPHLKEKHQKQQQELDSGDILRGLIRTECKQINRQIAQLKKQQKLAKTAEERKKIAEELKAQQDKKENYSLFLANYEAVLKQNEMTAETILQNAKKDGTISRKKVLEQIDAVKAENSPLKNEHKKAVSLTGSLKQHAHNPQPKKTCRQMLAEKGERTKENTVKIKRKSLDLGRPSRQQKMH